MGFSTRQRRIFLALLLVFALAGCADAPPLPSPMTATDVQSYGTAQALVAYLSQPGAASTVCDPLAKSAHAPPLDDVGRKRLVRALIDGTVSPDTWRGCVDTMANRLDPPAAASLVDHVLDGYRSLLADKNVEKDPALRARLTVMLRFYLRRKPGEGGGSAVDLEQFSELRGALAGRAIGPVARSFGENLLAAVDAEHGRWHGRAVDAPLLDERLRAKDEKTLTLFSERLPDAGLRQDAARRIIRLHIAASAFPELRASANQVEETVLELGMNPVSLVEHAPSSVTLDGTKVAIRKIVVTQQIWTQTARLAAYGGKGPSSTELPRIQLSGALSITLAGLSRPVSVCGTVRSLDPTPCVDLKDIQLDSPYARLDKRGAVRFIDEMTMAQATALAAAHDRFVLPLRVGDRPLALTSWPLTFQKPDDVTFRGDSVGRDGPSLDVTIDTRDPERYLFTIADGARTYRAVVEAYDMATFRVVSAGAPGKTGLDGMPGAIGSDGGACQNGGRGGDGEDGDPGGPGGNGGEVRVHVVCDAGDCAATRASLSRVVLSIGGAGGRGGLGGAGGAGGDSGNDEVTYTDAFGNVVVSVTDCSAGSPGADGNDGVDGPDGPPGQPGVVQLN